MSRLRTGVVLRGVAVVSVLAALVVPACERADDRVAVTVLADLSASIDLQTAAAESEDLVTSLRGRLGRDAVSVVAFADRSLPLGLDESLGDLRLLDSATTTLRAGSWAAAIDRASTDLAGALQAASALAPGDRVHNVVLLSDGHHNASPGAEDASGGDLVERAVDQLQATGSRLFALPAVPASHPPAIVAVEPIGTAWADATLRARVELSTSDAEPQMVDLEFRFGDGPRRTRTVEVAPGGSSIVIDLPPQDAGSQLLSLRLSGTTSRWLQTVEVAPARRLLAIEGGAGSPLWTALERRGWQVDRLSPTRLPRRVADYDRWQVVVLSDVAGATVAESQQRALRDWVLGGGALLFAAGPQTFGEGGWNEQALEDVLPLHFRLEEEENQVALMIALDKSYSMKGDKITLAKEATKGALGELQDRQLFGLVAFDWNTFDVVPLQEASARTEIRRLIDRIEPSAQTNFYPALESTLRQLSAAEDAKVRHVILISDGKTYPDDYEGLLARMRDAEITVSTVAVGEEADRELLAQIADWGDGQSYFVRDAARVQRILLDEARQKSDRTLVEETLEAALGEPSQALRGLDLNAAPALRGYQTMEPTDGARVILTIGDEKPLLAVRQSGLGTAWVFASDLSPRWSADWIAWDGWAQLWSQLLGDAAERRFDDTATFAVERTRSRFSLRADLQTLSGAALDGADVQVELSGAAEPGVVPLRQTAGGRYETRVDLPPVAGADYRFALQVGGRTVTTASTYYPQLDERSPAPLRLDRLQALATRTGGQLDPTLDQIVDPDGRSATRQVVLWPWLVALALLCVLVELTLHRLGRD